MNKGYYILHDLELDSEQAVDATEVVALCRAHGRTIKHASDLFKDSEHNTKLIGTRYMVERVKRRKQIQRDTKYRAKAEIDAHFTQEYQHWFALEWTQMQHLFGVV